jgi:hypothetical protein
VVADKTSRFCDVATFRSELCSGKPTFARVGSPVGVVNVGWLHMGRTIKAEQLFFWWPVSAGPLLRYALESEGTQGHH